MATNTGHASVSNGIGHLQVLNGSGSYIIVSDPDQVLGTFDVNGSVNGYYHVTVNGITPAATTINLNNLVTAGTNSQYETGESFDLVIGQVPSFNMTNGSATTCNATFFDSGGENANYIDNEDFTMTFNPGTAGARVKAIFSSFDIEDQSYSNVFHTLNLTNGRAPGVEVRKVMMESGLPKDTLSKIWNLCDKGQHGALSEEEFIIGMALVNGCIEGKPLPENMQPV